MPIRRIVKVRASPRGEVRKSYDSFVTFVNCASGTTLTPPNTHKTHSQNPYSTKQTTKLVALTISRPKYSRCGWRVGIACYTTNQRGGVGGGWVGISVPPQVSDAENGAMVSRRTHPMPPHGTFTRHLTRDRCKAKVPTMVSRRTYQTIGRAPHPTTRYRHTPPNNT